MDLFHNHGNVRYAAFCCLAVARCEKALQDTKNEAMAYANTGHEFYLAELEKSCAHEPSFEEYVSEATQCYLTAISLYLGPSARGVPPSMALGAGSAWTATAGGLYHELATLLLRLGRGGEACTYFLRAAEVHQSLDQYRTTLASLWNAVDASISQCDYMTTCVSLNWIVKVVSEMPSVADALQDTHTVAPRSTLKNDELKEALLTLVLALMLQGDFQQAKDYVQKLADNCAADTDTEAPRSDCTQSEFISILLDFIVCTFFVPTFPHFAVL